MHDLKTRMTARACLERLSATNIDLKDNGLCTELFNGAIAALVRSGMSVPDISDELRVSRPTVERWSNSKNLPHPGMRGPCLRFFHRTLRSRTVHAHIVALKEWSGSNAIFADLVAESRAFSTMLGYGDLLRTELSREFEVANTTVDRWANGVARPHPTIARKITASIARRLAHQLEDVERIEKK